MKVMNHFTGVIMLFLVLNLGIIESQTLNWRDDRGYSWTNRCSFSAVKNVLSLTKVGKEACSNSCISTPGCTHYFWSKQKNLSPIFSFRILEYCSLRSGTIAKSDVQTSLNVNSIYIESECGIKI